MTWFKDNTGHILESKNKIHRLVYCPLCAKLLSKGDCKRLRQSIKNGNLYEVKSYRYSRLTKKDRTRHREERDEKRVSELIGIELHKIVKRIL
jgi:hypothetical protein